MNAVPLPLCSPAIFHFTKNPGKERVFLAANFILDPPVLYWIFKKQLRKYIATVMTGQVCSNTVF
jgi:hypothetical protein